MVALSKLRGFDQRRNRFRQEVVCSQVHAQSLRSDKPMVYVNCAALPNPLLKVNYSDVIKARLPEQTVHVRVNLNLADGGTIFLDEIGELPLLLQAETFACYSATGEIQRGGADKTTS